MLEHLKFMLPCITRGYRLVAAAIFVLVLSSCVTQSGKPDRAENQDIEINEAYGIDEAMRQKFNQAVALIRAENYSDAIPLLLEVTAHTEKHSAPYINLGVAYSQLGKINEAEENLLKALKINPAHPVTSNELGLLYRKSGRFAEAKKIYQQLIAKYPLFLPARKNLGILCDIFMQDFTCAMEQYQAYLDVRPDDKKVSLWLADVRLRAGQN